jgi:8-oxo-dGTP pyrophosphatase MutT (NUDIX family)
MPMENGRMGERVRAALLDGDEIVLFKRTRPGVPVYWSLPGGGVEPRDADLVSALRRELDEELLAQVSEPVWLIERETTDLEGRQHRQHLYACRLVSMDFDQRHGPEFSNPKKGLYEVERLPFTVAALQVTRVVPPELAKYLRDNVDEVKAAVSR